MVGGLLVSQLLTLFTTPVIYLAFESCGAAVHRLRSSLPASQRSARRPPNRSNGL